MWRRRSKREMWRRRSRREICRRRRTRWEGTGVPSVRRRSRR